MINTGRVVEDKHSTTEPEYWEYISLTALTDVESEESTNQPKKKTTTEEMEKRETITTERKIIPVRYTEWNELKDEEKSSKMKGETQHLNIMDF